jgi:hypothetical protein
VAPAYASPLRAAKSAAQGSASAAATENRKAVGRDFGLLGGPNESIEVGFVKDFV